jgi:hypothetical protein
MNMNNETKELLTKVTDQIPKGGTWIALNNLQLAINIAFSTIYQAIKLGIFLAGLYYLYNLMPMILAFITK